MSSSHPVRVLVTGATGFIANHIIVQLLQSGYSVRGTARRQSSEQALFDMLESQAVDTHAFELVEASLESDEGWETACQNCHYVIHVASPFPLKLPKDENKLIKPAREGALRVLKHAADAGVKRTVLTSSTAAIVYGRDRNQIFDEKTWSNIKSKKISAYQKSKTLAEKAAWEFIESPGARGMELSVINPGLVLGPLLRKECRTSAELIRKFLRGGVPGLPNMGWACVDVRDVAAAHISAMETPCAAGERFICATEHVSMRDIADVLRGEYGQRFKIPTMGVPDIVVKFFALFDQDAKITLNDLGVRQDLDSEKARRLLGWKPRSLEEMVLSMANSLIRYELV